MSDPRVPKRVRTLAPNARIIIMLREPGEQCFASARRFTRSDEELYTALFEEASNGTADRTCPALRIVPWEDLEANKGAWSAYYTPCNPRRHYLEALERWMKFVPRSSILLLQSEELRAFPHRVLRVVEEHLGLSPYNFSDAVRHHGEQNKRGRHKLQGDIGPAPMRMSARTRQFFDDCYAPVIDELEALLGRCFRWGVHERAFWVQRGAMYNIAE